MASKPSKVMAPGTARCPGPSYQDLLNREQVAVPDMIRADSYAYLGCDDIPVARYTSEAFFQQEVEKLWPKVWQMACRQEDIPTPGDSIVYDIVGWSFIVLRTETGAIRAYYNSCLHRGRKLRTGPGRMRQIRCPYHGFTWALDGAFKSMPCPWDFPHLETANMNLPQVKVDSWAGFVFINMDPQAKPLRDYLEVLPTHFARWQLEDCAKVVHVAKVVAANWKATAEAFMESFHAMATHPQILPYSADANAKYDIWGDHVNRNIAPMAVPSPHVMDDPPSEQEILNALVDTSGRITGEGEAAEQKLSIPEGVTAREFMAEMNKQLFAEEDGHDYSDKTNAEMLDAIVYNLFPNLSPWGGFVPNIVYRWRPNGRDVHSCLMEVMFLKRVPKGGTRSDGCPVHFLEEDQPWSEAEELGALGPIFDQDMGNLPQVQAGMRSSRKGAVSLGNYQEIRIRHFHRTLDKYLQA